MKVVMLPVQVMALWKEDGTILPLAMCLEQEGSKCRLSIDTVQSYKEERILGRKTGSFLCHSADEGRDKVFCLRFDFVDCRWFLYKI